MIEAKIITKTMVEVMMILIIEVVAKEEEVDQVVVIEEDMETKEVEAKDEVEDIVITIKEKSMIEMTFTQVQILLSMRISRMSMMKSRI